MSGCCDVKEEGLEEVGGWIQRILIPCIPIGEPKVPHSRRVEGTEGSWKTPTSFEGSASVVMDFSEDLWTPSCFAQIAQHVRCETFSDNWASTCRNNNNNNNNNKSHPNLPPCWPAPWASTRLDTHPVGWKTRSVFARKDATAEEAIASHTGQSGLGKSPFLGRVVVTCRRVGAAAQVVSCRDIGAGRVVLGKRVRRFGFDALGQFWFKGQKMIKYSVG